MAVSRALSFVVGLALAGLAAMAAFGQGVIPERHFRIESCSPAVAAQHPDACRRMDEAQGYPPTPIHGDTTITGCPGSVEQLLLLRAIAERLGVHQ